MKRVLLPSLIETAAAVFVEWMGPAEYRAWADKAFADQDKVAIKIGTWKQ